MSYLNITMSNVALLSILLHTGFLLICVYLLSLSLFSHVYTQFMTWRCLIRFCAVFHIVVISRNHPPTRFKTFAYKLHLLLQRVQNFMLQHVQTNHEGFYPDGYTGWSGVEVFTEDARPEDPGPVRVRVWVYILNGQPGPGRVPIYYFVSRVYLTFCVIPESIGEHRTHQRSVSVSMRVFCNLQFVKLGWEKSEREIK